MKSTISKSSYKYVRLNIFCVEKEREERDHDNINKAVPTTFFFFFFLEFIACDSGDFQTISYAPSLSIYKVREILI